MFPILTTWTLVHPVYPLSYVIITLTDILNEDKCEGMLPKLVVLSFMDVFIYFIVLMWQKHEGNLSNIWMSIKAAQSIVCFHKEQRYV